MRIFNLFRSKLKIIFLFFICFLFVGIAIPKLTVRDVILLTDEEKNCVQASIKQQLDHPLQRIALAFGKSAVVERKTGAPNIKPNTMIVESYTIFRIPLPVTRMFNRFTQQITCDWATEKIINAQPVSISIFDQKLSVCNAIPNNSIQKIKETTRLFINFPKEVYPDREQNLLVKTVSGNATAGRMPASATGEDLEATAGCWSYRYDFEGMGEVDLTAKSAIKDMPDYFVRFIVEPAQ